LFLATHVFATRILLCILLLFFSVPLNFEKTFGYCNLNLGLKLVVLSFVLQLTLPNDQGNLVPIALAGSDNYIPVPGLLLSAI
jgi:hypothetical protein